MKPNAVKCMYCFSLITAICALSLFPGNSSAAAGDKPNIVIIWGDDIGQSNVSAYSMGVMGYQTPNIDKVAKEGMIFTDYYAEQSCTAGRASFITGQSGFRTGLTKVGMPGAELGMHEEDPTLAELLKPLGYATGQFGKNHLGDRDEMLPTNHGFDEFYGNLYHLNAEEEPEHRDYPKKPEFRKKFGPRGVIHSYALPDGGQKIVFGFKYMGRPGKYVLILCHGGLFDDRPFRGQVSGENNGAAFGIIGIGPWRYDIFIFNDGVFDDVADGFSRNTQRIMMQVVCNLLHQCGDAPGLIEIRYTMGAAGGQPANGGDSLVEVIKYGKGKFDGKLMGQRRQVERDVGGSTDGHVHGQSVFKGFFR